jgi:hypothetical protein
MENKKDWGKSAQGMRAPKQYIHRILCHGKRGLENSIDDMKWGAHILDIFSTLFLVLDFYFLDFCGAKPICHQAINKP